MTGRSTGLWVLALGILSLEALSGCGSGGSGSSVGVTPTSTEVGTTAGTLARKWQPSVPQPRLIPDGTAGTKGATIPTPASAPPIPYTPIQIRHAYQVDQLTLPDSSPNLGAGQVIGIVDGTGSLSDTQLQADLTTFSNEANPYGSGTFVPEAAPNMTIVHTQPGVVGSSAFDDEIASDIEWAHAIAPAAKIVLVLVPPDFAGMSGNLMTGVDVASSVAGVHQVSFSYGGPEAADERTLDSHFRHAGVTYCVASDDEGCFNDSALVDGDTVIAYGPVGPDWPASSPYVVACGGTNLQLDDNGNVTSAETGWGALTTNPATDRGASGGGQSAFEPRPAFQAGVNASAFRQVPDVALDADPQTGYFWVKDGVLDPGGFDLGGTSFSAPEWAGLFALANAERVAEGLPTLQGEGTSVGDLYTVFSSQTFTDIVTGFNGLTPPGPPGFNCGTGYDEVTGLGTPLAKVLIGTPGQGLISASIH